MRARKGSIGARRNVFSFRVTDEEAKLIKDEIPEGTNQNTFLREMVIGRIKKGCSKGCKAKGRHD